MVRSRSLGASVAACVSLAFSIATQAQTRGMPVEAFRIGLILPAQYAVQGAPFTAELEATWSGGANVSGGSSMSRVMRDSAGRQRFEAGSGDLQSIMIYDVPGERTIRLDPQRKVAVVTPMAHVGRPILVPVSKLPGAPAETPERIRGDSLGSRTVAGLEAQGFRTTMILRSADGTTTQTERDLWLSPAYRMPLMSEYDNPRYGRVVERVTSLVPDEPPANLFVVPSDYRLVAGGSGGASAANGAAGASGASSLTPRTPPPVAVQSAVTIKNVGPCVPQVSTSVIAQIAEGSARVSSVKGFPFSATGVVTVDQKLADGNSIHGVAFSHLARDGGGRTRLETVKRCWLGPDGEFHAAWKVEVSDPGSRTIVTWDTDDLIPKVAKLYHLAEPRPVRTLAELSPEELQIRRVNQFNQPPQTEFEQKDLGSKTLDGLSIEGYRRTHTIPSGEAGNDRPMEAMQENWSSKQLGQTVIAIDDNPTQGRTMFELKDVRQVEPDPALFAVPEGYRIEDVPRN